MPACFDMLLIIVLIFWNSDMNATPWASHGRREKGEKGEKRRRRKLLRVGGKREKHGGRAKRKHDDGSVPARIISHLRTTARIPW
jgi:hypothetical protein